MGKWKSIARVITYPIIHPGTTAKTAITTAKGGLVVGSAGYIGWDMLAHDKSLVRSVSDTIIGEDNVDAIVSKTEAVGDLTTGISDKLTEVTDAITGAGTQVSEMGTSMNGVRNFFSNLVSGNGGNMFGNFFKNLFSGDVSGMGIAALVGGALLAFGRFGWFGKIAGALLMMFTIGANARREQTPALGRKSEYASASVYPSSKEPGKLLIKAWGTDGRDFPSLSIDTKEYYRMKEEGKTPIDIYDYLTRRENKTDLIAEDLSSGTVVGR